MQNGTFQIETPAFQPNNLRHPPASATSQDCRTADRPHSRSPLLKIRNKADATDVSSEIQNQFRDHDTPARSARQIEAHHLLSNGLAHDLNNLFQVANSALSLIELRSKLGKDVDIPALVEKAELALDRAKSVARRLTLLPVQSHGDVGPVDVNSAIHALHGILALLAGPKIEVRLDLMPSAACIACNRLDLENALLNVVANSRNAMADGGIIAVRTAIERRTSREPASDGTAYAVVRISDTGHGMSPEVADRAFDAFYSTRTERGGTGLGLAMVRRFLEDVGGASAIESTAGVGTSISLFIPLFDQCSATDASARPDR